VSLVKYELRFYIPEDGILHSHCCENLKGTPSGEVRSRQRYTPRPRPNGTGLHHTQQWWNGGLRGESGETLWELQHEDRSCRTGEAALHMNSSICSAAERERLPCTCTVRSVQLLNRRGFLPHEQFDLFSSVCVDC
jgi:hypothetical protein